MARTVTSRSREHKAIGDLRDALGSSLDIRVVLERAYPLLLQLVPGDYGALGISSSGKPEDYEWIVTKLPPAYFTAYPEMAPHDFVRMSVARQLNVVLRDEEMIGRSELEANMMYRRAREVGVPLEQVMAVMLHIDDRWQSGLAIYREKRRPFSERERATLQSVTPAVANAVRNCHEFSAAADRSVAFEAWLQERDEAIVLIAPPATEVARLGGAAQLMEKWFAPHERRAGRLPEALLTLLAQGALATWTKRSAEATLEVTLIPLAGCMGKARWMLRLRERPDSIPVPPAWRALLTRREQEVASAILRGWDNRLISEELYCTAGKGEEHISEATVKVHVRKIFDKLGVQSRTALVVRAAEQRS